MILNGPMVPVLTSCSVAFAVDGGPLGVFEAFLCITWLPLRLATFLQCIYFPSGKVIVNKQYIPEYIKIPDR